MATHVQPADAGSVAVTPSGGAVLEGTSVSFKATPKGDYVFSGWSGSLSGSENPATITVTADVSVTANFTLRNYPLTLSVEGEGSIEEKVVSTKADYASGTVVELTAVPASGWSFDHWEGDISGSDNPAQIAIASSAKAVKAVFTKNSYAYNLTIVGPGAVDEYLVEDTKTTLDYGTKVLLKAFPADGAIFKGWSGGFESIEKEVVVDIDSAKELTATFETDEDLYKRPFIDLYQPSSMTKRLYYGLDFSGVSYFPTGFIAVDYDLDGFVDAISCHGDYPNNGRLPMVFYKGPHMTLDEKNNNKYLSLLGVRKSFVGDFNGDSLPDICFVGHGNEDFPNPRDYPVFLMSKDDGTFERLGIEECFEYYHGSAAGDFDNDGDLDVVLLNNSANGVSCILENDGSGSFTPRYDLLNYYWMEPAMYTIEFFDLDHDGFLDIICGGNDYEGRNAMERGFMSLSYDDSPFVLWGNGISYSEAPMSRLPSNYINFGDNSDFAFYDLNGDGMEEIIIAKSADGLVFPDGLSHDPGKGWMIQVFERHGRLFTDETPKYVIDDDPFHLSEMLNIWVSFEEWEGCVYLFARKEGKTNSEIIYRLHNGVLIRVQDSIKPAYPTITSGYPILTDVRTMRQGWQQYAAIVIGFQDGIDLSKLVSEDYCLEMYIQNTDPSLTFDCHFDLFSVLQPNGDYRIYGTGTSASDVLKNDGSWERLCIPLKNFDLWGEGPDENYWNRVDQFVLITTSTGGTEFSVKDIRIRKVLPES